MIFLAFIFQSFWHWLGFVAIVICTGDVIVKIIAEIKKPGPPKYITAKGDIADFEKFNDSWDKNSGDIK